ncbi:MAG: hypothetical protein QNJ16_06150 [Rhodobacter sp.]|nr:hypothetical protein [Rhodobacter sp.]
MASDRQTPWLFALVVVAALPAIGAYLYYHYTKDPLLQPLGITRESLAEIEGPTEFVSIITHVDWGRDVSDTLSRNKLRELVRSAFATRTDDVVFRFNDVPGDEIEITFVVGPNRFGPYRPSQLIDGVIPSTVALQMTRKARRKRDADLTP